jgi:uncharacterized protein YgiM (DUF1202 family)
MTRLLLLLSRLLLACSASKKLSDLAPTKTAVPMSAPAPTAKTVDAAATVCTDALNVRTGPSLALPVVAWLRRGDRVRVLESANGWMRIGAGWIRDVYLCHP